MSYNFNSEFYMIQRILIRRLIPHPNIVYFFSKDPFEKFNRKKDSKIVNQTKTKSSEKAKIIKNQKLAGFKFDEKLKKDDQPKNQQKKEKEEQLHHSGFQKLSSRSHHNSKKRDGDKKDHQRFKETQNSVQNETKSTQSERGKQENQKKQEHAQTYFKQETENTTSTGFERFKKRSPPQKIKPRTPEVKKKDAKHQMDSPKEQKKPESGKKIDIPQIKIDLDLDNDDGRTVLRKSKGFKAKKQMQQNPPESNQQQKIDEEKEQNKIWQNFQQQKERIKVNHRKNNAPRYQRLNLIKDQKKDERKNNEQEIKSQPTDIKKNLKRLVIAGLGLVFIINNKYFKWSNEQQVDPQYLISAIEEERIDSTWIQNTESTFHNDLSVKGKNYESFIYVTEKNGNIYFCPSNQEFERLWLQMVEKHNQMVDKRATDPFPIHAANDPLMKGSQAVKKITVTPKQEKKISSIVADTRDILSMALFYFFIKSIIDKRQGAKGKGNKGMMGLFQNEKSHRFKEIIKVTFQDVVGMQKAKDEIVEFIDFLKYPQKYNKLGARIPKGALLTGPPGTGKTMIAKACAGESKVPFFTISGSQFIEMYVGVGAQRVRNLFKEAKENAPSIIFIDEIDAVGKKRSGMGGGGNDERDTTLNQLLVEMDGFDTNTNVIVFAATNQREVLDPALTRPGRFDRMIEIDLPDLEGRCQIFQVHLKPLILDDRIDIKDYAKRLATLTPGFSGADIKNVCNEAAIIAARNNKQYVSIIDFELATERIIGGVEKRSQLITPQTRKTVAYHECGHGVVSWFIENANPLLKLTIIPRSKGALGFAQYLPNEHQMYTKAKLLDEICVILGGRVSEEIFFGKISTGASDDLNKAYQIAKAYVTQYGFGDRLGWIQYGETEYAKEYSKQTENVIDEEILKVMSICSERTRTIVHEKKELIHKLAQKLLELQTIDQNIITGILGERPFKMSKQHEEYIKQKRRITEEILASKQEVPPAQTVAKINRSDYVL